MNKLLEGLEQETNYTYTEKGGVTHKSTLNAVLDMFAMGGAARQRSDNDIIMMFKNAYEEDKTLALRCLFYLRDARAGQGERRFFRVIFKWLANEHPAEVVNLIPLVAEYGRYDDLYTLVDTPVANVMFSFLLRTVQKDKDHLVYKWLKSENTSSEESRRLAKRTREAFGMNPRQYRKMLSEGRKACNLVETLMSQNQWDQIAFDKLPSRAGLLYKNAFMRREETRERYAKFMASKSTKVNASVLNPVDIAHQIFNTYPVDNTTVNVWQKYWDALPDYYCGREEPGIAVCDVSGSMTGLPMDAAVSLGAYIAERGKGPFRNRFITFSDNPSLIRFEGVNIYDKFHRARKADWGGTTNIEAVFDLLLNTGIKKHVPDKDMPKVIYIFSDMEFDACVTSGRPRQDDRYMWTYRSQCLSRNGIETVIEAQMRKWRSAGYTCPRVIFWNLASRQSNIPAIGDKFSYVSGFNPVMIENILSGKSGMELMLDKLNSPRYEAILSVFN